MKKCYSFNTKIGGGVIRSGSKNLVNWLIKVEYYKENIIN